MRISDWSSDVCSSDLAVAKALHPARAPIAYRTGDYADLAQEQWDFIISSIVAHHMSNAERLAFLDLMERHASRGWFVHDLYRQAFAYHGFQIGRAWCRDRGGTYVSNRVVAVTFKKQIKDN